MTIRSKQILSLLALAVAISSNVSLAQIQSSSAPLVTPIAANAQTAVPALVPFSGVAVDREGRALSRETGITFLVFKDQKGGEPLFIETQRVVPDSFGRYTVHLGASRSSGIPIDLFSSGEARWLEVQIGGEPTQPRILLTSVPYALKAADAATLGGLPASAFIRVGTPGFTSITALRDLAGPGISPAVTSTAVTTDGGISGRLSAFSGASNISSTQLYTSLTYGGLGIGRGPAAALDVLGQTIFRGGAVFSRSGEATPSAGKPSFQFQFQTSVYNSNNKGNLIPNFTLQTEPIGNNTAATGASLNFLYYSGIGSAPIETGLYVNPDGTIHFAPAQTFPGGGGGGAGGSVCIATGGGFGGGGTTFVGPSFAVPAGGGCSPWSGFTKTATTVVLTTSGAGCVSSDGKKLTLSVSSADPNYLGAGTMASDYIQLTRPSTTGSFTSGSDQGQFSGSAVQVSCTASLLQLNETND